VGCLCMIFVSTVQYRFYRNGAGMAVYFLFFSFLPSIYLSRDSTPVVVKLLMSVVSYSEVSYFTVQQLRCAPTVGQFPRLVPPLPPPCSPHCQEIMLSHSTMTEEFVPGFRKYRNGAVRRGSCLHFVLWLRARNLKIGKLRRGETGICDGG